MLNIIYDAIDEKIFVEIDKKKVEVYKVYDVNKLNLQCKHIVISYLLTTIQKLCDERLRAYGYVYNPPESELKFFNTVAQTVGSMYDNPSWRNYVHTVVGQMYEHAPSPNSRFYKNYIERLKSVEQVFNTYARAGRYYKTKSCVQLKLALM